MTDLIKRNTPQIADRFILRDIESIEGKNHFEIYEENGRIVLAGDCKISQAMAYYRYLRKYCKANLSHCGNTSLEDIAEAPLPAEKTEFTVEQDKRVYMNYCTFGYSCAGWDWDRWEKEIDFMAMNGINMPLSVVGSEAVWYYTLRDLGYSETGALSFISGPCFWPWQLMGNIAGYFPVTDAAYIEKRAELGKKIIDRQVSLGMTPIQQGFSGNVPRNITKLFPRAKLNMVPSWCNFPVTWSIDPLDPLFRKFGTALLEKQRSLFGAYHYYACDPFHENKPASKKKGYLPAVARAISGLYEAFDSKSVWVMQSWSLRDEIVSTIPPEKLLILDINGEKYKEHNNFDGYNFVLGEISSFGDRNTLHGSIKALADNPYAALKKDLPNVVGTGLFPEGIMQNPMRFDLAFEMMTQSNKVDIDAWLDDYALRRYGSDEQCLKDAVKKLYLSCYNEECTGRETGSVICARPTTELRHTAPNDHREFRYDTKVLFGALQDLLKAGNASKDGYIFDVCDITRQVLSNYCSSLYDKVMYAFYHKDVDIFERASNAFMKILEELDELLQTRPELCLATHLKDLGSLALSEKDKQNFEVNLLAIVTFWGPFARTVNYDYGWKEWGGMISTFYAKRWQSFFEQLAVEFPHRRKFSTTTKKQHCERNEFLGSVFYKNYAKFERSWLSSVNPDFCNGKDTLALARALAEKYERAILED